MTSVAILQPSYLPWLGYFEQIDRVDHFVFLDDVQYTKNDWRNRNQVKSSQAKQWITVPVHASMDQKINQIKIDYQQHWIKKHLKSLEVNYKKAQYFDEVYELIAASLDRQYLNLSQLCVQLIQNICSYLGIQSKFYLSSELNIHGERSEKLLEICRDLHATKYYSGQSAKTYLNTQLFEKNKIQVQFQNYHHPEYSQLFGQFISHLSIIDLLFNCGKMSYRVLKEGR